MMTAMYYRSDELDACPVHPVLSVGEMLTAPRIVAWVGYAKNPLTVQLEEEQVLEKMGTIFSDMVEEACQIRLSKEQARDFWEDSYTPLSIEIAFRRFARYLLFRQAFPTCRVARGLWFQDIPVEATIIEIVTCRTGHRYPGSYDRYGGDDLPYLGAVSYHWLYGCRDQDQRLLLVYPGDVEGHGD